MELLFESRADIVAVGGRMNFFQARPTLHPEPVLGPDSFVDGAGTSIYGTVLRDGGRYRMWYQAWPKDWGGKNIDLVGYAESDNGLDWRKPRLGLVEYRTHGRDNNLVAMGGHPPTLFIDPDAPSSHRYRATMCTGPAHQGADNKLTDYGYYTAHSPDGFQWQYDTDSPRWKPFDVINCVYHPGQRRGLVAMKNHPRVNGATRRAIWSADMIDGHWSDAKAALVPDEFDDVAALARGYVSGDYYGMGMLPAGRGTVGFLWQFRHRRPPITGNYYGVYGIVDVTLTYQPGPGERWMHVYGRPDFLSHSELTWARGGFYTSSAPVQVGQEHWLYFTGAAEAHGWYLAKDWQIDPALHRELLDRGMARIGVARWPLWRLFGYRSDPQGTLDLNLGRIVPGQRLHLNHCCQGNGSIRVEVLKQEGRTLAEARPLTGDALSAPVAWIGGDSLVSGPRDECVVRLHVDRAEVYAFEVVGG
jgi:hypothetical protein